MRTVSVDRSTRPPVALLTVVAGVWLSAVTLGLCVFWAYGATPGQSANAAVAAAATRPVERVAGRASIVMFVHPQCPCSRASLDALATLLADHPGSIDATVIFADVADGPEPVEASARWAQATAIGGVHVRRDVHDVLAMRFDAHTSGQTFCYAADGTLAFSGGLTAARGQVGDSAGTRAVDAICAGGRAPMRSAPVFGCSLR